VCLRQMQDIAGAMLEYAGRNGHLPRQPSDLRDYFPGRTYDNGRISYRIFISPADEHVTTFPTDAWGFVNEHCSYDFHVDADPNNSRAILLSERHNFLWPNKKAYAAVGGHAFEASPVDLAQYLTGDAIACPIDSSP